MYELNFSVLQTIGLSQTLINCFYQLESLSPNSQLARVTEVHRDRVQLNDGQHEFSARLLPALQHELQGQPLAVGDWVVHHADAGQQAWLSHRLEPINQLARRDANGGRQLLASNIDTALLLMGLDHDFNPRRLERYLALTHSAGIEALVLLSKADLCTDLPEKLQLLQQRLPHSCQIIAINGRASETRSQLLPWLAAGQTLVLLGSSGAGKSTLTNTLLGRQQQDTGAVREDDSRGRHTTTSRSLHLCPGGACIIDTPGVRTLQPDLDEDGLTASFSDIDQLAEHCRFRDCQHQDEPGCAVRSQIDPDRLRNYHKLLREARRGGMSGLEKQQLKAQWKQRGKAGEMRAKMKRQA